MSRCITVKQDDMTAEVEGLFLYGDYDAGNESMSFFLSALQQNSVNFDDCIGSYRVHITCPDGKEIYFSDNAGVMRWYLHQNSGKVFSRLSDIPAALRHPDMPSIAQFLWFGCIYETGTLVENVIKSDPECFYVLQDGAILSQSKNLTPLEQLAGGEDALERYMRRILRATNGTETIGCTITAGTDSRSILAHLKANGVHPLLSITGTETHPDVQTAQKIAAALEEELLVISGLSSGFDWIASTEEEVDGQAGICGAFRLLEQFRTIEKRGITLQFGGGAGEFYKNSFINQDYPFYKGKPNWQRFLKMKVITYDFPKHICGEALLPEIERVPAVLLQNVSAHDGGTKASAYLSAGYRILQARASTVSVMENRHVVTCNPLLERSVVAPMLRKDPYRLEMQSYQRTQVAQYCPEIMDIPTDRGLTLNPEKIRSETLKSLLFLLSVAFGRILRRKKATGRVDPIFASGLKSEDYSKAVDQCKQLGILDPHLSVDHIPDSIADRIFTVGQFFRKLDRPGE